MTRIPKEPHRALSNWGLSLLGETDLNWRLCFSFFSPFFFPPFFWVEGFVSFWYRLAPLESPSHLAPLTIFGRGGGFSFGGFFPFFGGVTSALQPSPRHGLDKVTISGYQNAYTTAVVDSFSTSNGWGPAPFNLSVKRQSLDIPEHPPRVSVHLAPCRSPPVQRGSQSAITAVPPYSPRTTLPPPYHPS